MSKMPNDMQVVDEDVVKRVAHVIGISSAAQAALRDAEQMRARGGTPGFGYSREHSCYIVFDVGHV